MKKITRDILEQLWRDPANWKSGLIYYCQGDPRVIVPRRPKWRGWTINFAHRYSLPALLIITLIVGLPLFFLAIYGLVGTWIWWAVLITIVTAVCLACWYWASPDRYTGA
jgi:hypothetical protein